MKLIIDIPDHIYSMVTNTGTFGCYRFNTSKAIRQGVPFDDLRAEIEQIVEHEINEDKKWAIGLKYSLQIIDKYKAESEE